VFQRISWLSGGGGLTAPCTRSNRPLWLAGFRDVSAVVGACVLWLLVEFVPRTSSTPVATWFWQTEGRSAERVIWGSDRVSSSCRSFNLLREEFLSAPIHSPPLWSPNRSFAPLEELNDSTKGLDVWHGAGFCCEDVRSLLQTSRVYIYTLVLTRLLVDYE
jgi:hypothetical protein